MTEDKSKKPRILPWFIAMILSLLAMGYLVDTMDIDDPLLANLMMAWPIIFLIPAARAAMKRAERTSGSGAPSKRYLQRMLVASFAYVGSLFLAVALIDKGDPVTPLTIALAILPGLGVVGYFWAIGSFIVEIKDEFIKMLLVRQSLIGAAFAFSLASIYGFLENFELVPHLDAYWWPIAFFLGIGIGALVNKLQYGTAGECA